MTIDKIYIIKRIITATVGLGTAKIVRTIIENNVEPISLYDKVTIASGTYALAGMVADTTKDYTDAKVEEIVASVKKFLNDDQPTIIVADGS